jgi:hypothetical protein
MHGQGKMLYSTGDEYQGQWQFHGRHGQGEMQVCAALNCQYKLSCRLQYARGGYYKGQWAEDMRWGEGSYENEYGLKHQGQWQRDKMHGHGKQVHCGWIHLSTNALPLLLVV